MTLQGDIHALCQLTGLLNKETRRVPVGPPGTIDGTSGTTLDIICVYTFSILS